jgi:hypothetical protein
MQFTFNSFFWHSVLLPFLGLAFSLISLIVVLNCLWRSQKHLKTFLKLCVVAVGVFALRKISGILGLASGDFWQIVSQILDVLNSLFFMFGALELYKIIKGLDNEELKEK